MEATQLALLDEMKSTGQDFEWYPTTNEIIESFLNHCLKIENTKSLLDIGAGNGKVLNAFYAKKKEQNSFADLYAIEKSKILLDQLDGDISIVGTDFAEQTLVDKRVDVIFSNPPYSEFVLWAEKIIREANAGKAYLVIPQRWKDQALIQDALKARKASAQVVDSFDFESSEDRQARAKVDLVFIDFRDTQGRHWRDGDELAVDPFDLWASDHYNLKRGDIADEELSDWQKSEQTKEEFGVKLDSQLVAGKNLIEAMCELYMADLNKLIKTYKDVASMDPDLMRELDVSVSSLLKSLKLRIKGLKNLYWNQLFDHYEPIVSRLTSKSRSNLLSTLREKTNIDFTSSNAYAVTIWAIKNANQYIDKQLIKVFEEMISRANVVNYKSNQLVFGENTYRYNRHDFKSNENKVKLEYRIVCEWLGGIDSDWGHERRSGLSQSAYDFLGDLLTVANNLGFAKADSLSRHYFRSGQKELFSYFDNKTGQHKLLVEVKAFKNGNLHLRFAPEFMLALNVEAGRLKGWIHNAQQAAEELGEDLDKVQAVFKSQHQMLPNAGAEILLLGK